MADARVCIRGSGPLARACVERWRRLSEGSQGSEAPALAWLPVAGLDDDLRKLARCAVVERRGSRLRLGEGDGSRELELVEAAPAEAILVELDGLDGARVRRPGAAVRELDAPALLAARVLLEALDGGPGLRWALLSTVAGRRGLEAPLGRVDLGRDEALIAGLTRTVPGLVGRVQAVCGRGPQLGDSLELSVLLASGASLASARDLLARLPDTPPQPGRAAVELGRSASSDDALGRGCLLLDGAAIEAAGPLLRVLAHYDPAGLLAAELWRTLS